MEGDSSAALERLAVRAQLYRCNAAGEVDTAGEGCRFPRLGEGGGKFSRMRAQLYRCNAE